MKWALHSTHLRLMHLPLASSNTPVGCVASASFCICTVARASKQNRTNHECSKATSSSSKEQKQQLCIFFLFATRAPQLFYAKSLCPPAPPPPPPPTPNPRRIVADVELVHHPEPPDHHHRISIKRKPTEHPPARPRRPGQGGRMF